MGGLHKYMFCELIVILGLTHGYGSRTSRKFDSLERKMEIITMELLDVKADLRVEKSKYITLENKLNVLMDDKKVNAYDDKDSDLTEHHSVVHNQQEVGSVAMSVEQRIYDAMKDEKNVRKQFEKQMKTDFITANKHTEMKFITLKETLSAVIDNKLDTIEDKVHASVAGLNEASSSMANLTIQVQHNDDAITSLMLESDQLNTTLLRYGTKLVTIEVDLANKVEELIDNNHRYKVRCFNGAKHSEDGTCECTNPYYGTHCEKGCFNDGKYLEDGSCECSRLYVGAKCEKEIELFDDCYDIHKKNTDKTTGIYTVKPHGLNTTIEVKCDMDIDGGGWTVFQYRHDGSVDFFKKFDAYENGFGILNGEFWLGLRYVQLMTSSVPSVLRIDVAAADGTQVYQTYDNFYISEGPDYRLNVGTTSGSAGDDGGYESLSYNNGRSFTTYDRDRDGTGDYNCAERYHGAWWYSWCGGYVNLNGQYVTPGTRSTIRGGYGGMIYYKFKENESLKSSKFMFRKK